MWIKVYSKRNPTAKVNKLELKEWARTERVSRRLAVSASVYLCQRKGSPGVIRDSEDPQLWNTQGKANCSVWNHLIGGRTLWRWTQLVFSLCVTRYQGWLSLAWCLMMVSSWEDKGWGRARTGKQKDGTRVAGCMNRRLKRFRVEVKWVNTSQHICKVGSSRNYPCVIYLEWKEEGPIIVLEFRSGRGQQMGDGLRSQEIGGT